MNRALFFTVVMAALSLLSSCHCLYLTEQLDEPDRRVPIIMSEYDKTYEEAQRNFWKHKGNYYTMARVHYAREPIPLLIARAPRSAFIRKPNRVNTTTSR